MNTQFNYKYRDGANYKTFHAFVFEGEISEEQIKRFVDLCDDEMFIPRALGLTGGVLEGEKGYDAKFDHYWCEHDFEDSFMVVPDAPDVFTIGGKTGVVNISDFLTAFEQCSENWEVAFANPLNLLDFKATAKEVVLFASLLPESIGAEIDSYFEKNGWTLLSYDIGETKGYQVFFGKGVQVDNLYEYGFSYLYDKDELMAFAKDFYAKKIIQALESVHDAETFPFLGYTDDYERLSQFIEKDNRFFDYAWAVSKPHGNDSIKKDYIAFWDQGNGWCNVFGVFEGITQEQFVSELKNIQQQSEQEKPELNNLIESASSRVVEKDGVKNIFTPER